ncbi:FAD-binding protein [Sutterella faecalis]|uniref:NAD(P)-binding protein n=2 Tax=Sutterella TaxID=40544 RepID=A0AAI9SEY0_9BURK|nr:MULTISPECIES: NAD(P)-binding protein [Sutterella]KAB7652577.1 NAD(P)-binding protein [Sutterella seckii]MBE5692198.1 FAD-binding protein [Sutterella sp.]QDA54934.1 FAD-binding protein [Sutterella faecalis]
MTQEKPFAITLDVGSSLANRTGSWRTLRPVYVNRLPPCNAKCPAGEKCRDWLFLAQSGDYEGAWKEIVEDNPFPAVMGRVCYHTCQTACNRGDLDEPVGINAVERFLGDHALKLGWKLPQPAEEKGKRILVVGAGPAGLSAAYHLRRMGYAVHVVESAEAAGGMMRYGIPKYRLPREVLDEEIARIEALGVEFEFGREVSDLAAEMKAGGYAAAFIGAGASLAHRAYIPAGDAAHIMDAVSLLRSVEASSPGEEPLLGRRVVVYGGGNTAIDVARTAKRLGSEPIVVYRRTRERAPAHAFEIEEALEEGVSMKWLSTISEAERGAIRIEKMKLDESGYPQPTGEYETIEADSLVLALGQETNLSFLSALPELKVEKGSVVVDERMMTSVPGIFAGGDVVPGDRNVTVAIGHGKRAAKAMDAWIRGEALSAKDPEDPATFEKLNTWYYADAPQKIRPQLDIVRRQTTFEEVLEGLTEENALFEARRCMSCGNCFECDNCYGVCPDNAVVKLGPGKKFRFNYDYCKGCGICANECPCGAIEMVREDI